eukprot:TRINITY_DN25126_c0_g1_i1.p1 TRINITY_DN25126_c0_g1~~TRINITY_DN25126_c0_g1_i1.p1  ORF type:complete len:486 (-),score=127.22 TRINITY_DN25126_c0_g1_i1:25-1482(-)
MPKGGAGVSQPRKLVSTKRVQGTILDWRGKFGWVQAAQPIDHPDAERTGGKIYLAAEDVQEELQGIGAAVTFFVYVDGNGLGAMNVRPSTKEAVTKAVSTPVATEGAGAPAGGAGKGEAKAAQGSVSYGGGYSPSKPAAPVASQETVLENVHKVLNKSLWKATKKVAHMDKDWDHNELFKRVLKYIYKGAQAPELMTLPWDQAATQFVESSMQGYSAACGDKPWFFDLDLAPSFGMAFWEIHEGSGQRASWQQVESALNGKYEEIMDACLLEKAIWDSAGLLVKEESVRNKLYKALKSGHDNAFKEAMNDPRPMPDLERVEVFTRAWVESSMGKAWSALETGGLMTPENLVWLFQDLLAPFGEEHPFSCVPAVLTQQIGRPPREWPYLDEAVRQFFLGWHGGGQGGRAKRPFVAFGAAGGKGGKGGKYGNGKGKADWQAPAKRQKLDFAAEPTETFAAVQDEGDAEDDPVAQALLEQVAAAEGMA